VQERLIPPERPRMIIKVRTYIYLREDGKTVHCNAAGGIIGAEYEHDDPDWQPPDDWPYEITDLRKERS